MFNGSKVSLAVTVVVLSLLGTGCDFDSSGTGSNRPPTFACDLDLMTSQIRFDIEPHPSIIVEEAPVADQPFWIRWGVVYHDFTTLASIPADDAPEYLFVTRIEIRKDNEIVFELDRDSGPIKPDEGLSGVISLDQGLPAGHYIVSVHADPDGVVPECNGLTSLFNNQEEVELHVLAEPIDDLDGYDLHDVEDNNRQPSAGGLQAR